METIVRQSRKDKLKHRTEEEVFLITPEMPSEHSQKVLRQTFIPDSRKSQYHTTLVRFHLDYPECRIDFPMSMYLQLSVSPGFPAYTTDVPGIQRFCYHSAIDYI